MSEYKNGGNNNMLWEQGVPGSNPGTPTQKTKELQKCDSFFCFSYVSQVSSRILGRGLKNRQPTFLVSWFLFSLQTIYSNFNSYISKTIRV